MVTSFLRRTLLGKKEKFSFRGYQEGEIDFNAMGKEIGIYIHIPFCKSMCHYCPYNKVLYEENIALAYKEALMKELVLYKEKFKNKKVTSIYIGGGTPTLLAEELKEILAWIKVHYHFQGDIGIEVHPTEVNRKLLKTLKEMEVNLISVGVQTFNDEMLQFLGRGYTSHEIDQALSLIKDFDFQCVDIDIMTNLPGQKIEDIQYDLEKTYAYGIDQLSVYPLILFPMTTMSKVLKEKKLSRFGELEERKILQMIDEVSKRWGYHRSSVWTYGKSSDNRYTSVTRESFVGFGAGASSHFGDYFYLNTFDVKAYIGALKEEALPINIVNLMTEKEKMIFWIFWRCYDGMIDGERFRELFHKDMKKGFKLLFDLLKYLKMAEEEGDKVILTEWGRYAYHFVEKQYSIHYLNYLWKKSMEEPWIEEISI
ncbi:oxygen-independent coproporphyrinogen-III oxidase 1 [Clostridium aceticum]|uniref:Heme chaperone HemW n=1 Tax=Clostridium aceticum TaxID=84022 RepID=A0A0D8IA08_9CLOT|nr:coproporphyrinogen-III oxidase family protein [Clostridium aceticum]AKL95909.1 oxygen-independent coproporphyrinogen-III oxidase 1 [Clostridium aceticum]KJF27135.1 coproporphyrinogen III oxidase [Clostridium aceticum]